jgi:hypothetical protein
VSEVTAAVDSIISSNAQMKEDYQAVLATAKKYRK